MEQEIVGYYSPEFIKYAEQDLREKKRKGDIFNINDFGVFFIPGYFASLRITFKNGRMCKPMFVVHDGKLLLPDPNDIKNLSFMSASRRYPEAIEFVDHVQFAFSNVASNIGEFLRLDEEKKKIINFVDFNEEYRHSVITSQLLGVNHNMGIRNIFNAGQEKQKISVFSRRMTVT